MKLKRLEPKRRARYLADIRHHPGAHSLIGDREIPVVVVHIEAGRANRSFGRRHQAGRAGHQIGRFARFEHCKETAHRETRRRAVIPVWNRAECFIDLPHQLRKVERKRTRGFHRTRIHQYDLVRRDETGECGGAFLVLRFVTMEPVNHRVAFG